MRIDGHLMVASLATVLAVSAVMLPAPACGTIIDVRLDPDKFGKLDQGKTACPDANCGPTAAVNSFVYLQNTFPNVYKVPLVPSGKEVEIANTLNGKDFMGTCCIAGAPKSVTSSLGKWPTSRRPIRASPPMRRK
jgi:hypothetical protein